MSTTLSITPDQLPVLGTVLTDRLAQTMDTLKNPFCGLSPDQVEEKCAEYNQVVILLKKLGFKLDEEYAFFTQTEVEQLIDMIEETK